MIYVSIEMTEIYQLAALGSQMVLGFFYILIFLGGRVHRGEGASS